MRRLLAVTIAAGLVAVAFAAWSVAARTPAGSNPELTAGEGSPAAVPTARRRPNLPRTPPAVRRRGRWRIGVKCDTPPFGYTDPEGRKAGYDVEIGRWMARFSWGNARRVSFECVTTASRIPALTSRRVDMIIATIIWFPYRAQDIDFSTHYYS